MPTRDDQYTELLVGLTRIEEQIKGVNGRLDKLNGTVAGIITDVSVVKAAAVKHPFECGYGPKILEIERRLATGEFHGALNVERELDAYHLVEAGKTAAKATVTKFWENAKPFIYAAIMTGIFLVVMHFNEIWSRKP